MKNNKGFSLVELIVVIAIMAILAAVAIPTFASFITKANVAADVDFMSQAEYAFELAYAADPDFDSAGIEVTLKDGKADVIVCDEQTVKASYKGKTVGTEVDGVKLTQEQIDAANAIDWEYNFKSVKENKTYVVSDKVVVEKNNKG